MHDSLGDRMKSYYEDRTRYFLPRRSYTVIRVDGKAFSTLTQGLMRPLDKDFAGAMQYTAIKLYREAQNCKFVYQQSDEISLVLADFGNVEHSTEAWFDNNLQKMSSVCASVATAHFNHYIRALQDKGKLPDVNLGYFDARVFSIPTWKETVNYLRWRQQDCLRNATQNLARSLYSHKELNGKNIKEQLQMIEAKGKSFADYPYYFKMGWAYTNVIEDPNATVNMDFMDKKSIEVFENILPKYSDSFTDPAKQGT
jgi:tRNA(His) guanylyltransferase